MSGSEATPPDQAITRILHRFADGGITREEARGELGRLFAGDPPGLAGHLAVLLDDVAARRITVDEARRDLVRAAVASGRGDRHCLVFLAPVHA